MFWQRSVIKGIQSGLNVIWELAKVIIPAVIVVQMLERTGALAYLSRLLGPVMGWFGLPGEGALVLVAGNLVSFYSGLAALVALDPAPRQMLILGAMLLICHGAISETALVARAGARTTWVLGARVLAMVLVGAVLNIALP